MVGAWVYRPLWRPQWVPRTLSFICPFTSSFSQQTQPWKPSLAFMFFPSGSTHRIHSHLHSVSVLYHFCLRYQLPFVHFLTHAKPSFKAWLRLSPLKPSLTTSVDSTHFLQVHSEGAGVNRSWLYEVNACWHMCGGLLPIPGGRDSVLHFLLGDRALFLAVTLSQVMRP